MSQNQQTPNQKRPAPAQNNKQAPAKNKPAPDKKKPAPGQKRPAPAPQKAPKTQAFDAVNNKRKGKKSHKPSKRLVIAIFAVIVLILAAVLVLIIGNIMNKIQNQPTPNPNVTYVEKSADDIRIGDLLLINENNKFDYALNGLVATDYTTLPDSIENLWTFKNKPENNAETKISIPGTDIHAPTYELANPKLANQICLDKTTLNKFNQMMLDYCKTLDLCSYTEGSASKINVAWGWSHEKDLLENDIPTYGNAFLNHADGKTLTLMKVKAGQEQDRITESILRNDFEWIFNHAHEYGFIVRYPNACEEHTGFNSNGRLHLRYVGVEHATFIFENGCCLEKYIETLRTNHGFNNPLSITANGKEYQVYYVKCEHQTVQIPVIKDSSYTISGDNMNGFIVTVEK